MNILDNILSRLGYTKAHTPTPGWLQAEVAGSRYSIPDGTLAYGQARAYQALTWIATAIDTLANVAATTEFSVYQRDGEDKTDIPNHDFEIALTRPNPHQSQFEFLRDLFSWLKLSGNGYVWLNRPNENTPPSEMWIIPTNMIKPVPDGQMFLKGYLFTPPQGSPIPLETWEISHVRTFNPFSRYVGLSAIESLMLTVNSDLAEQKYNANFFSQDSGRLPGILAFADNIGDTEWEAMKQDAKEKSGGTKRAMMMLRNAGPGGVQYLVAGATQKEMEFLNTRQFNKEEIWSKLAPGILQILDKNTTEANALAGKAVFSEYAVYPLLILVGQKWNGDILPAYGDNLEGEFDDPRKSDKLMDLQEQDKYSQTHTIDEIRAEYYGDDPIGDNRGKLFPAQIGAFVGALQQESLPGADSNPTTPETPSATTQPAMSEAEPAAVQAELKAWENFALKRLGKGGRDFEPRAIPILEAGRIMTQLKRATTPAQVRAVFSPDLATEASRLATAIEQATAALNAEH